MSASRMGSLGGGGRPGVARDRIVTSPLAGADEAWLLSSLEVLWRDGLCRPGAQGDAERARVDEKLSWRDWTDTSRGATGLARAARGCLACPSSAASVCAQVMTRLAESTGTRLASVTVAATPIPWRGAGEELVARSAGWSALPLRVVAEEVA